jgi:hypothetical protein
VSHVSAEEQKISASPDKAKRRLIVEYVEGVITREGGDSMRNSRGKTEHVAIHPGSRTVQGTSCRMPIKQAVSSQIGRSADGRPDRSKCVFFKFRRALSCATSRTESEGYPFVNEATVAQIVVAISNDAARTATTII